jgi:hypothetical protein
LNGSKTGERSSRAASSPSPESSEADDGGARTVPSGLIPRYSSNRWMTEMRRVSWRIYHESGGNTQEITEEGPYFGNIIGDILLIVF